MRTGFGRLAAFCASAIVLATPAAAASYDFDVLYFGNNVAGMAAGSDQVVGTTITEGDDFTYTLTGINGTYSSNGGGFIFPFIALALSESGTRVTDYTVTLFDRGRSSSRTPRRAR